MKITDNNPRRDFLKKIPVAIVSISAFSFFKIKKTNKFPDRKFDSISTSEANEIIKNEKFTNPVKLNPAPAPFAQKNING